MEKLAQRELSPQDPKPPAPAQGQGEEEPGSTATSSSAALRRLAGHRDQRPANGGLQSPQHSCWGTALVSKGRGGSMSAPELQITAVRPLPRAPCLHTLPTAALFNTLHQGNKTLPETNKKTNPPQKNHPWSHRLKYQHDTKCRVRSARGRAANRAGGLQLALQGALRDPLSPGAFLAIRKSTVIQEGGCQGPPPGKASVNGSS